MRVPARRGTPRTTGRTHGSVARTPGRAGSRHRPDARQHQDWSLRAQPVGPDRGRRAGDRGGDLLRARQRQLRQQDDVGAGGARPGGGGGGRGGILQQADGQDRAAGRVRRDRRQRPARDLPACPGDRAEAGRLVQRPLQPGNGTAAARAAAGDDGRRHGTARRDPAPRAVTGRATGRFPGFDVLSQSRHWDTVTADVVSARTGPPPQPRFFTGTEQATATALLNQLTGQCDEPLGVPVMEMVDARLAAGETDGWRYADLPEDGQAWRETLAYLDKDAQDRGATSFVGAPRQEQAAIIQAVQDSGEWHGLPAS